MTSQPFEQHGHGDVVDLGQLAQRREPGVQLTPLDLLVVGERKLELTDHVELGQPSPLTQGATAVAQVFMWVLLLGHVGQDRRSLALLIIRQD